jgi:peptide chain release factor 1
MSQPDIARDPSAFQRLARESKEIAPIVERYRAYKAALGEITKIQEMVRGEADAEMREMAHEELRTLEARRDALDAEIPLLLIPKDPNDEKNVLLEIRAGTGGEEAALFAAEVFRMYTRFAERERWKVDVISMTRAGQGGIKEVIAMVEGDRVYSKLRYESGVHRVQRVPATEASGRIHTSAITVAVLPEAEEVDVKIDPKDIRIDTFCSSGPGGQSVNTTYSAVRITHLPTNTVVSCQDEKSQIKNREKAMKVLRARLYEVALAEQQSQIASDRKSQVGSGDRSEKIRTYNFQQARVTDHRIGLTLHRLHDVLDGDLEEIVNSLIAHAQAEKLKDSKPGASDSGRRPGDASRAHV